MGNQNFMLFQTSEPGRSSDPSRPGWTMRILTLLVAFCWIFWCENFWKLHGRLNVGLQEIYSGQFFVTCEIQNGRIHFDYLREFTTWICEHPNFPVCFQVICPCHHSTKKTFSGWKAYHIECRADIHEWIVDGYTCDRFHTFLHELRM